MIKRYPARALPAASLAAAALTGAIIASLSACAVGPNFKRPTPPDAAGYGSASTRTETAAVESAGGSAQRFVSGMDIPGQWWTLFKSPQLDHLVEQALKANPDVGAAQAALRQAHELYRRSAPASCRWSRGNSAARARSSPPVR